MKSTGYNLLYDALNDAARTALELEKDTLHREWNNDYNLKLGASGAPAAMRFDNDECTKDINLNKTTLRTQLIEINSKVLPEREEAIKALIIATQHLICCCNEENVAAEDINIAEQGIRIFNDNN